MYSLRGDGQAIPKPSYWKDLAKKLHRMGKQRARYLAHEVLDGKDRTEKLKGDIGKDGAAQHVGQAQH